VTGATFSPSVAGVGRHTITYRNDGSKGVCGSATQVIEVILPKITLPPDTTLCPGSRTPFQLRANLPGGTWSGTNVSSKGVFTPPPGFTGTIEATYSLQEPCVISATQKINLPPIPSMQARLVNGCSDDPEVSGYAPFYASFSNNTVNATQFTWFFGDGTQSEEREPRHLYAKPGRYVVSLLARYGNGCEQRLELGEVVVAPPFIPNIFTPNGDGKNDTFVQHFSCLPTEITVYNRWGKLVHQEKIYNQKWDGGSLSEGTYYYLLKDTEGNSAKGWVEIVR
jgi:gliding motility-associated-like protein